MSHFGARNGPFANRRFFLVDIVRSSSCSSSRLGLGMFLNDRGPGQVITAESFRVGAFRKAGVQGSSHGSAFFVVFLAIIVDAVIIDAVAIGTIQIAAAVLLLLFLLLLLQSMRPKLNKVGNVGKELGTRSDVKQIHRGLIGITNTAAGFVHDEASIKTAFQHGTQHGAPLLQFLPFPLLRLGSGATTTTTAAATRSHHHLHLMLSSSREKR
mmetsp:Transcript_11392/g.25358  ORF Transcript_11392/g.25358 Transcript_11392/m.25358 type:complete len:212 (+) Transcript_11392:2690-3325(+)